MFFSLVQIEQNIMGVGCRKNEIFSFYLYKNPSRSVNYSVSFGMDINVVQIFSFYDLFSLTLCSTLWTIMSDNKIVDTTTFSCRYSRQNQFRPPQKICIVCKIFRHVRTSFQFDRFNFVYCKFIILSIKSHTLHAPYTLTFSIVILEKCCCCFKEKFVSLFTLLGTSSTFSMLFKHY